MGTSAKRLSFRTGRSGRYFTKFSDDRWFPVTGQSGNFMFRGQLYPSASAALGAYISENDGMTTNNTSSKSHYTSNGFMFRGQLYASASAALDAYIQEYEGIPTDSSLSKSRYSTDDVDELLTSLPGVSARNRSRFRGKYESVLAQSQLASDVSMTLEESQRVLDRINNDDVGGNLRNSDVISCITDNTDVLLQAKAYPTIQTTKHKKAVYGTVKHRNCHGNSQSGKSFQRKNYLEQSESVSRPCYKSGTNSAPSWVQDLAQSEISLLSNGNLSENKRLYSSQPRIGFPTNVREQDYSGLGKAFSLNDLNHNNLEASCTSSQLRSSGISKQLHQKLVSVEKRNKMLRQLLYSHNIVGQGTVLKPVRSEASGTITPDILPAGRNVHFSIDAADILTSTFQNTPKKLTVDVSSIESANSSQQQESSYIQKHVKRKGISSGLSSEAARILVSDVPNEKHKEFLGGLIQDIEDSSSSVITTPWLEVLQKDLGMKTGDVPSMKSAAERKALAAEVEEIIRVNTQPSTTGSVEELLIPCPPAADTEVISRQSLDTEEILNGDRSWEAPPLSLKKPVCVDQTVDAAKPVRSEKSHSLRIMDQFLTECMGSDEMSDVRKSQNDRQQHGSMETLKNMLFSVQAMAPEGELDDNNASKNDTLKDMTTESSEAANLEVQKIVQKLSTENDNAQSKDSLLSHTAVPDELKHLLSVSFDAQVGTDHLDKAMAHLKKLQTLTQNPLL